MKTNKSKFNLGYLALAVFAFAIVPLQNVKSQDLPPMPTIEALKEAMPDLQNIPGSNYTGSFTFTPSNGGALFSSVTFGFSGTASDNYVISGGTPQDFPNIPLPFTGINKLTIQRASGATGYASLTQWAIDIRSQSTQIFQFNATNGDAESGQTITISGDNLYDAADIVNIYTDPADKDGTSIWQSINAERTVGASNTEFAITEATNTFYVEFISFADLGTVPPGLISSTDAAAIDNTNDLNTGGFQAGVTNIDGLGGSLDLSASALDRSTGAGNDIDGDGITDQNDTDDDGNGVDDQGFGVTLREGWNLVSVPIANSTASNMEPSDIFGSLFVDFEDGASDLDFAFEYDGTDYQLVETLEAGKGYWVYASMPGDSVYATTYFGDLIGSNGYTSVYSTTAAITNSAYTLVGSVVGNTVVPQAKVSAMYSYVDGGYVAVGGGIEASGTDYVIRPGRGYWILGSSDVDETTQASIFNDPSSRSGSLIAKEILPDYDAITLIHGDEFNVQKMTLNDSKDIITPPAPPRSFFTSLNGTHLRSSLNNADIVIREAVEPIVLKFNPANSNSVLRVTLDGNVTEVAAGGSFTTQKQGNYSISVEVIGQEKESNMPNAIDLGQNYPNPFNPTTAISYTLNEAMPVQLNVFNMNGQKVATLVNATQSAGSYNVNFDASNLASGLYVYRLTTPNGVITRKMTLMK